MLVATLFFIFPVCLSFTMLLENTHFNDNHVASTKAKITFTFKSKKSGLYSDIHVVSIKTKITCTFKSEKFRMNSFLCSTCPLFLRE